MTRLFSHTYHPSLMCRVHVLYRRRTPYPLFERLGDATSDNDIGAPLELLSWIVDDTFQHYKSHDLIFDYVLNLLSSASSSNTWRVLKVRHHASHAWLTGWLLFDACVLAQTLVLLKYLLYNAPSSFPRSFAIAIQRHPSMLRKLQSFPQNDGDQYSLYAVN